MTTDPPPDERARLEALKQLGLLDTPAEPEFDELVALAAAICGTPISTITLVDTDRQWFKAAVGLTDRETQRSMAFCAHAIHRQSLFTVSDTALDERFAHNPLVLGDPKIRFYAGMPISAPSGHLIGTLCVIDRVPRQLTPEQNKTLEILGHQVNARIELRMERRHLEQALLDKEATLNELQLVKAELELANYHLEKMATTDVLTGLRNRRVFEERLSEEFYLSRDRKKKLSLILLDVDDFKHRNDHFGHSSGDAALKQLAILLGTIARKSDTPVRYGGEEFAILVADSNAEQARSLAERILVAVRAAIWPDEPLTVSIGVAEFDASTDITQSAFVARADLALYEAKREGKDRFHTAEASVPPAS